ncbi:DUF3365 domain-containing protein [Algoriphagus aquimarinus]|uniref:Tll0287-like domain-containing protein n=1 Tax=Algoriphagus aquimarinus TaxID=237018 RepID=UPI0030DB9264
MKNFLYFLIPAVLFLACGPQERISKSVFDEVNKGMEAKKLSEAQITQEAMIWGDSISNEAQQQLMANLHKAVNEQGATGALNFCNVNAAPIIKKLSEKYGVIIRRTSSRARNQENLPIKEEFPILDAYQYNAENGIENKPNIQTIEGGDVLLYTKAIVISTEFCLSCHGDPQKDIETGVLSKIDSIYPRDLARGFEVGDLRGMWSLKIPKKDVVLRF